MTRPAVQRWISLLILVFLAALVAYFLFCTETGARWQHRDYVHARVHEHPVIAPVAFIVAYIVLAVLLLPVWWLQILVGFCFGIVPGVIICEIGATLAAMCSVAISRWLAADWFHRRVESQVTKLRALDEKLGRNGLLVVMTIRLIHVVPFSISNYALGLLDVRLRDVALGTLIGGFTTNVSYVIAGNKGKDMLHEWRFLVGIVALNLGMIAAMWLIHRQIERRKLLVAATPASQSMRSVE
ncbi:MAG TPA: VTT domain-containing protein [Tepidisphaeraceae bacterium]|jgi:uncharacterized membrane protein YdjX (TVP38/TMEM64 family)|nr:VTT domain-containing protein [Tepidisphaeraceae bacterium]